MRGKLDWEDELIMVYRHEIRRNPDVERLHIRISQEIAQEIQDSRRLPDDFDHTFCTATWQGIPMRIDWTLKPGCFVFEEGEDNDRQT